MQYRKFGKTGVKVSALGFGAMRLPAHDEDLCISILRRAFDSGVNYVDTAFGYCEGKSETIVGKALKGYRDRVYVSTKYPPWNTESRDDYRRVLEDQLARMDCGYIDFYHFHGLSRDIFENRILKYRLVDEAIRARDEGLIRHISFSFHDKPEVMKTIIETGAFESVLCQYNLLDRGNEEAIAYAASKGLGVAVMGPVAGGKLGGPSRVLQGIMTGKTVSTPELALRFVLANPDVSVALSGMSEISHVEENVRVASNETPLTTKEKDLLERALLENKKLADLYCTGCQYCMPCPNDVNIPLNFSIMNYHRVYGLTETARAQYAQIGTVDWMKGNPASACVECGLCEPKCPQKIKIREQLKETARMFER